MMGLKEGAWGITAMSEGRKWGGGQGTADDQCFELVVFEFPWWGVKMRLKKRLIRPYSGHNLNMTACTVTTFLLLLCSFALGSPPGPACPHSLWNLRLMPPKLGQPKAAAGPPKAVERLCGAPPQGAP